MDTVSSRQFIRTLKMTESSIFALVDHSRSLNINEEYFCIEFDRKTLMVIDIHMDVSSITVA